MAIAAEAAIRAWVNDPARGLAGNGNPLAHGAFLREQRSPSDGSYAVVARNPEGVGGVVAEDGAVAVARVQVQVFAGTEQAAEQAAAALRTGFESLTGCPERCGDTGVLVLVADNHNGPFFVAGTSEQFCFQVGADFVLTG